MKLMGVVCIPDSKDYTYKLPIKNILNNEYNDKHEIYNAFRKAVPDGRFGLAISEDATGKYPLMIIDTQLLARGNN
tara:strand:+ start:998 stop:1225 length:228 start_codon:yes stop_codon:yes gene_type:complete